MVYVEGPAGVHDVFLTKSDNSLWAAEEVKRQSSVQERSCGESIGRVGILFH